ncbi:MAG TPA: hemolysin family protein [Ktedonobacterales bacterium]|nr:hemolysin family protein [Ktedonobacterales bacterium]
MDSALLFEVAIILALILLNGFFAASEIAVVSSRRSRLERRAQGGQRGARQALDLAGRPDRFLATVQVGITLISTIAAAFGGARLSAALAGMLQGIPAIAPWAGGIAFAVVVVLITYFTLVLGELIPKRIALNHADGVAARVAPAMNALARAARPVVALLTGSVNIGLRLLGQAGARAEPITEEDIVYMIHEGAVGGVVEEQEERLIRRVFRFTDRRVEQVMTPRADIAAVEIGEPLSVVRERFLSTGHSRLPVYEGALDEVRGVLFARDLLREQEAGKPPDIRALLRPPLFVTERQHIDDLLATFQREGAQLAFAVDEYGQISGLVTLQDVLEELVGEIKSEYGTEEEGAIRRLDDGSWMVDGGTDWETVHEQVGLPAIPPDELGEYATIGGLILTRLGRIPHEGDTLTDGDFQFDVVDMDGRRIDKVRIQRLPPPAEEATPDHELGE